MSKSMFMRCIIGATPFALCLVWYYPTLAGAFLSDDYAVVALLARWERNRSMWSGLLHQFGAGLESPSNYYRPLTFVTFGINYALAGADPGPWRLVNLGIHLANGLVLFVIVRRLVVSLDAASALAAPALAAGIFLLFPTSPEAVAWVSGRYDSLATFFTLAAVALFQRSVRTFDRWNVASLLIAACALASKESGVLVVAWIAAAAVARHAVEARPMRVVLRLALYDLSPWLVLILAYFGLRTAIFGDPVRVFPGTSPASSLLAGEWLNVLTSAQPWLAALFPRAFPRALFEVALIALLVYSGCMCWLRRRARAAWLGFAGATALSIVLLLPHLQTLSSSGEEGRLFYSTSALLALMIALPFAFVPGEHRNRPLRPWARCATIAAATVLIVTQLVLLRTSLADWTVAGTQANALLDDLPSLAMSIPDEGYAFVLVPDHIGSVPFGRNGQGGMISPPTQADALSLRLIVQTPDDLPAWPGYVAKGLVDVLRRYPLAAVWKEIDTGHVDGGAAPTQYFCWRVDGSGIVTLDFHPMLGDGATWLAAWRDVLAKGRCAVGANDIPRA